MKINKWNENIYNIPNALTFLRIIITIVIICLIFTGYAIELIIILFVIGMITDTLDGQIARRFKLTTEFGRRFDMVADRFLLGGTALALIINLFLEGNLTRNFMLQLILIMSREIVSFPIAIYAFFLGRALPKAKFIGKTTTFIQAFSFPCAVLSVYYPELFSFSIYLALINGIVGLFSGFTYINDVLNYKKDKNGGPRRR